MWKLIFSTATNRGVACNRNPEVGEYMVELPPSECGWFMSDPQRYEYVEGALQEVTGYLDNKAKTEAFTKKSGELLDHRHKLNNVYPFMAGGVKYVNDESNIQGVKVQVLDKPLANPLPTFMNTPVSGSWRTFDNGYTTFTNESFINVVCETYFTMRSHNFTNHGLLETQLTALYEDPASTIEQIEAFDITTGWSASSVVE